MDAARRDSCLALGVDVIRADSRRLRSWGFDAGALRADVEKWFTASALKRLLGPARTETDRIARAWLARSGKRWRPFILTATFGALCRRSLARRALPEDVRKLALAVECFHKASLIHDDIEDSDATRYGEKTLHVEYGVPVALNTGDLLLGEGYRLIGEVSDGAQTSAMLRIAAEGHRDLCAGQGKELCWMRDPAPLSAGEVVDIFRGKTAPPFRVALRLGAICAGADDEVSRIAIPYSESLGVAYQIRDDIADFWDGGFGDFKARRLSLLLAIAYERCRGQERKMIDGIWRRSPSSGRVQPALERVFKVRGVSEQAGRMLESFKAEAVRSLQPLANADLKDLLGHAVEQIFGGASVRKTRL